MLAEPTAYLVALVALWIGSVAGYLVHRVSASLTYDAAWMDVPRWKKQALGWSGAIAAFLAGTIVLWQAPSFQPEEIIARMWAAQTAAGWLGPLFINHAWNRLKGGRDG